MTMAEIQTKPDEFKKFHQLLVMDKVGYEPFYFALTEHGKEPIGGISWKKAKLTFEQAYAKMKNGFNIGIAGTDVDDLVIIDIDDLSKITDIKPTLISKSRKRIGQHCFYFTKDEITDNIFIDSAKQNIATEKYGEMRSNWQYVVAAGSFVPVNKEEKDDDGNILWDRIPEEEKQHAGKYTVFSDVGVSDIAFAELPIVFRDLIAEKRTAEVKKMVDDKELSVVGNTDGVRSALYSLKIEDVCGKSVMDGSERFPSLFHGSKTGANTSIRTGLLHCWRHSVSHSPLSALAVRAGLMECSSAGYPHGHGHSSLNLKDGQTIFKLWEFAKKESIIPKDDPIPARALVWYAIQKKMCEQTDVRDGWKLPSHTYNTAVKLLNDSCTPSGRQPQQKHNEKAKKEYKSNGAFDYIDRIIEKNPIYYDSACQFWIWTDAGHYKQVDNTDILLTLLIDIADPGIIQQKFKAELLEAARLRGRDAKVKPVPTHWIHVQNGVYDVKTGELFPPTPEYLFTAPVPHKITDSEETPTIDKLFSEWVGMDKIPLLTEFAAYCLYNGYPIHRMFILVGRGRNGKGQYRDFVVRFIGDHNRTSSTLEQLINSRFETARLYTKKLCTMGEINYTMLERTAILKMLSGGDPVAAECKNKTPFDFVNTAKMLINTNSIPTTMDRTDAFYSRCVTIEFCNQFQKGKDIIETIPPEEYNTFLTKTIRVLKELLERGEFTNEGDIQQKEKEYERLSNPMSEFIVSRCRQDINETMPFWQFKEQFLLFLRIKGMRILSDIEVRTGLKTGGFELKSDHYFKEFNNSKWTAIIGLNLIEHGIYDQKNVKNDEKHQNSPLSPKTPNQCQLPQNSGHIGVIGLLSLGSPIEDISETTPICPPSPLNPQTSRTELTKQVVDEMSVWSGIHGTINSTNRADFVMGYFKPRNPDANSSEIIEIVNKLAHITPEHTDPNKKHHSLQCAPSDFRVNGETSKAAPDHDNCGGFGCECECHTKKKEEQ